MTISVREESKEWLVGLFNGSNPDRVQFEKLTHRHWMDIAVDRDVQKLNVNWRFYAEVAMAGHFSMVVVRDGETLVGYFLQMITPIPHYKHILQATEDSHYILPEYQKQGYGKAMVGVAEQAAINRGASIMKVRTKVHKDNSQFWEDRGFRRVEYVYQKVVRRNGHGWSTHADS